MSNMLQRVLQRSSPFNSLSMEKWVDYFSYGNLSYPYGMFSQTLAGHTEEANFDVSFEALIQSAYKGNGIVFSCMVARQKLFSEARFQFRRMENGKPGDLFGSKALVPLEHPWPKGTTGDLLARAIQDVDLAGNFFAARRVVTQGRDRGKVRIRRLRPDYVTIVIGSYEDPNLENGDIDAEVVGYMYHPGGHGSSRPPVFLDVNEVAHWAPIPDPSASYRGMSWVVPIIREYLADTAMVTHKAKFLEQGATPNMVVTLDPSIKKEAFKEWVQMFSDKHEGVLNAYKTLYLGAGASVTPVGKDFRQMEFAVTQAVGETRICAAAQVPPILAGVTAGIESATYSNYQSAKRFFADGTLRPLWRNFASSIEDIVEVPDGAELWYDDRNIPFLYDDAKDRGIIMQSEAATIKSLVDSGFDAESVRDAVMSKDFKLLKHTGLFSVQLLPPGAALVPNVPTQYPMPKPASAADSGPNPLPAAKPAKSETQAPQAEPTTPVKDPKKGKSEKKAKREQEREEVMRMMQELADLRRAMIARDVTPPQEPPSVEVHFHEGAFRAGDTHVDAPTTVADGAVRVDAPTTIEAGAFQIESNTTVEPTQVSIEEGAIRGGDTHVTTPDVNVEYRLVDGAIQVHSPVTIEKGALTIEEGAVRVEPPNVQVEYRLVDGAIQVHSPVTIEQGAVQIDSPVTVERTEVHVDEGAVRVDSPVTVERTDVRVEAPITVQPAELRMEPGSITVPVTVEGTEVRFDEGSIRVETPVTVESPEFRMEAGAVHVPVTVERSDVNINEGAVRVDSPVTFEPPSVNIHEGAMRIDAPITVERTEVHIDEGAVQIDSPVTVNTPDVTIEPAQVHVDAPVNIHEGAVQVDAPVTLGPDSVRVEVDAATTFESGAVQIDSPVSIESGAVQVDVQQPEAPPPARKRTVREVEFRTNDDGQIVGKREVETEDDDD